MNALLLSSDRCEELQLELAASQRGRTVGSGTSGPLSSTGQSWGNKGTEIERIMAKIEQDNRILAELDHSRSTTLGKSSRWVFVVGGSLFDRPVSAASTGARAKLATGRRAGVAVQSE